MNKKRTTIKFEGIKILTLGNSKVGKTSFIYRYTDNLFQFNYVSTQGNDYLTKIVELPNGKKYSVNFFDTAGQERFRAMSFNLIKKCDGILLIYDITDKESFESIPQWMENIQDNKGLDYPIILCGNKIDLENERVISRKEGEELAQKFGITFFETSNKDGKNVEKAAFELINQIIKMRENKIKDILKDFEVIEKDSFLLDIKEISKLEKTQVKRKKKC